MKDEKALKAVDKAIDLAYKKGQESREDEIKSLKEQLEVKKQELDKQQELEIELIQWVSDEVTSGVLSLENAHSMYDEFHQKN